MGTCLFALSVLFFIIGLIQLFAPERGTSQGAAPASPFPFPRPQNIPQAPAANPPGQANFGIPPAGVKPMQAQAFDWIQIGQRIRVPHPNQGELTLYVLGRIAYQELWQTSRGPQSPWVPTGNTFLGFWLENNILLLNWQTRAYLLDEHVPLSDADIQRDFLPYARQFAQSDQTATVHFAYPPASWKIEDIGKFRVQAADGEGLMFRPGATGRFIHSSGDSGRALVVEDYEGGGGGQDSAWIGYQIEADAVKPG